MTPTGAAIQARDLTKTYKDVRALDGLSFSVEAGTVFGLLGPNGAGKSTTVKILTTLTRPDSGQASVAGVDVLASPDRVRRAIGLVAQRSGVDLEGTGRENLTLQGQVYGLRGAELRTRVGELLERFGLAEAADRVARGYSGGMQRRLDIAMGLIHRPRVLFLDEPTTGLDPEVRADMWAEIAHLSGSEGLTILLTTHYLEEAEQLCDRIAFINDGEIVGEGTSPELAARYGVANLEDAYLALVGRKELSRSRIEVAASRREVNRFMKIKKQTLGAPLLETFLYITVFGAALGSRIKHLHGIDYVLFVIPGLIMMAFSTNAFANNSSSILQQKFQGAIQDQLSSPASPLELLLAFSLGGFMRGLMVATLTFAVSAVLVGLPVEHVLVLVPSLFLVGFFFAQLGVLIGVRAEQFDDVAFAQTFVLQPLIFLGGVFYSAALLPQPFETLTRFDPIFYMINLVRYGFVGFSEVSIALSLLALTAATAALFAVNLRLFSRGYKLRA
jgi:ABC-2 type transport system permease protein